mmetsp:Transcript_38078/g.84817  ORF Transcript_38078/g.84817 Transcript_38078/m.84817 type:complete len:96 (-) Transcript_38078:1105-1392(-)
MYSYCLTASPVLPWLCYANAVSLFAVLLGASICSAEHLVLPPCCTRLRAATLQSLSNRCTPLSTTERWCLNPHHLQVQRSCSNRCICKLRLCSYT